MDVSAKKLWMHDNWVKSAILGCTRWQTRHHIGMRSLVLLGALFAPLPALAQSQDICVANLPQFPQACPCIIERSQAQGINGPVLDALLANQVANLPIGTFQAYGAIFTQCITDAVTGQVPTAPAPLATAPAPAPAAPAATSTSVLTALNGGVPGVWDLMAIDFFGGGAALPGTQDGRGGAVALHCSGGPHTASLMLEGLDAPPQTPVTLTVTGSGGTLFDRQLGAQRYTARGDLPGPFWQTPLPPDLVEALRRGATLTVTPATGTARQFGLSGSARAIGPGACAIPAADRGFPLAPFDRVPDGVWDLTERVLGPEGQAPALRYSVGPPYLPELLIACDGSLALQQRPGRGFGDALTLELALDAYEGVILADLSLQGNAYRSAPLEDGTLALTAGAPAWLVAFDIYAEPGEIILTSYSTQGLAEGLEALTCPAPFEPGAAPEVLAGTWSFGEMPDLPRPDLFAAATFQPNDPAVPALHFECDGTPFFDQGALGAVLPRNFGYRLRVSVGDLEWEETFGGMRVWGRPSGLPPGFRARLLSSPDLRVTGLDAPGFDAVYPLTGLEGFFEGPLCQQ